MQKRTLGKHGPQVAPIALGGNVFGWTANESTSCAVLDAFVDRGFNLVDTADIYSTWAPGHQGGESETIIGNWLKRSGKRDQVVIATKVGMTMGDGRRGLRKAYILQAVEDSLRRLQTDYIDLYQSHEDDKETPLEETLDAYATLIRQGKVRAIGASNYSADRLREALDISKQNGIPAYISLQPEYNLYDRQGFEAELEPLVLKESIGVIGYYSLASGFLSGKYRSKDDLQKSVRGGAIGDRYLNDRGMRILSALDRVAKSCQTTPASVALAWLIHRPSVTAPIVSATSVTQLNELLHATEISLSSEMIRQLDEASAY
jgi:aryl-alcohol dehydrogenase-like predicted oxidoreductase